MKKLSSVSLLIIVSVFLSSTVMAQFNFGAVQNVRPFIYEEGGQVTGIDFDVFQELKKRVGFQASVKPLPFKRLWAMLQNGQLDGTLQIYYNAKREAHIIYSETPMHWSAHYIFIRSGDEGRYSTTGIDALMGKKVGKNSGFFVTKSFDEAAKAGKFKLEEATSTVTNLRKLNLGRIDCFVSNYHIALVEIKKAGMTGKIVPLSKPFASKKGTFLAISKKGTGITDKQAFITKINKALKEIHTDGTLDRITAKYTQ